MEDASSPNDPLDQIKICTLDCGARCCRYITVIVEQPRAENDWDEFRWWLAHADTMVTKNADGWMLQVSVRCRHLQPDNLCGIYDHRMIACSEYDAAACEFTDDIPWDECFKTEADLAEYLERRGLKRGAEVAKQIRAADVS